MTSIKRIASPTESAVSEDIMTALARFRLLNVAQLLDVTGRDEKTLRTRLGQLVTASYVGCREFRLGQTGGRLPNIYWLTGKGSEWMRESMGGVPRPLDGRKLSITQTPHRTLVIDALIAADRWARSTGQALPTFRTYMEGRGSRLELPAKTADADAILELRDTHENRRVYIVEVYCDYLDNANGKPFEKLAPYITAGVTTALDVATGITPAPDAKGVMVLVICDSAKMRDRVIKGLPKREGLPPLDKRTWQRFLFKSADELADFGAGWRRVDDSKVNLPS